MNNALFQFAHPANEPVKEYRPGSPERLALEKELKKQSKEVVEIEIMRYSCYNFLLVSNFSKN